MPDGTAETCLNFFSEIEPHHASCYNSYDSGSHGYYFFYESPPVFHNDDGYDDAHAARADAELQAVAVAAS